MLSQKHAIGSCVAHINKTVEDKSGEVCTLSFLADKSL